MSAQLLREVLPVPCSIYGDVTNVPDECNSLSPQTSNTNEDRSKADTRAKSLVNLSDACPFLLDTARLSLYQTPTCITTQFLRSGTDFASTFTWPKTLLFQPDRASASSNSIFSS